MAAIQITPTDWVWFKNGESGVSSVIGYEDSSRRVGRFQFTAPPNGATNVSITLYSGGRGAGSHIPIKFYIGTSDTSHANAGPESAATGTLTLGEDWLTFTGSANILLVPNQTYYLWVFPGEDTFGWYWGTRANYNSILTTYGAAMSVVGGDDGVLGDTHTLTLTRYAETLTHTISATCGNESMIIETDVQADSVTWIPPIEWAAQNTTGTSVTAVIICTTYNGSAEIGSTSVTLSFSIPLSVAPTAAISVTDKLGYFDKYGNYVQGKSQAQVAAAGTGAQGSTITGYSVVTGSTTKTGESPVFDLPTAGDITFVLTVTDSRGRTGSASVSITVATYNPPSAAISAAYRCDADGNEDPDGIYAIAAFSAAVTPLGDKNSATYALKYRVRGTSSWLIVPIDLQSGNFAPSNATQIIEVSTESGYELSVEVTDDFGPVMSAYRTVQVAFSLMDFYRAIKAIGFGQRATVSNTAAFGLAAMLNRGIRMNPITIPSWDEADAALEGILADLFDYSVDFRVLNINGEVWHCVVFKVSNQSATAEFYSASGRKRKPLTDGAWGELVAIR